MKSVLKYSIFIVLVASLDAVKFRCDYKFSNVGWLKYHELPANWHDARLRCRYEGGILASPTSTALRAAMVNAIRDVDIFTGIHATVSPGNFNTIEGIPLDILNHGWAKNEPDNKNNVENCIALDSEGNFSDVSCKIPRPYICYRPHSLEGASSCGTPDPGYRFESRTNKCYKFHKTPRTYERAHFICSAEGGHLAIVNSDVESEVIRDLFAQYPHNKILGNFWKDIAFMGFHNFGESSDWITLEGQTLEQAGFTKFEHGQPDNATTGEYCGSVFRTGLLNDAWCERHFVFMCEKLPNIPAVCDSNKAKHSKRFANSTLLY